MALPTPEIDNDNLLSPCGLYCGVCGIYVATRDNNGELRQKLSKAYGTRLAKTACKGCMQPEPTECQFPLCSSCGIRSCVKGKGFKSCAECDNFPCDKISTFPFPVARQFMLETIPFWRALQNKMGTKAGNLAFAKTQLERFRCNNCGKNLFRGATFCKNCNSSITPKKLEVK